jgi:RHH-type proline utilization regulon transcriptional repressor/proline dehydrogenase/delta 1-pyrroline-5-carboxylate dehydrogenase
MSNLGALQYSLSSETFADEAECVQRLLDGTQGVEKKRARIFAAATDLVNRIRASDSESSAQEFLYTYGLNTHEGIALMCLAEALLRIPDRVTADRLIQDKFEDTDWGKYLGNSESFFVNASSWGLLLTGKIVNLGRMADENPAALFGKLIAGTGEPVIREALRQAMRFIGTQFVLGESMEEALKKSQESKNRNYRFSYDVLGEGARNSAQAEHYFHAYCAAITAIGKHNKAKNLMDAASISLKLSALHPRYQLVTESRVMGELLAKLKEIITLAMRMGVSVSIDAEEAARFDIELELFSRLFGDPAFKGFDGIGFVLQAYQRRAFNAVDYLAALAKDNKKRMPLRLVKGAYWDTEIKNAQVLGLPTYPVFTQKEHTDVSYMACAEKIIRHTDWFYPQFGTHNALTVAAIRELMGEKKNTYEFQRLHGMGKNLHDLVIQDVPCRIYAPVGRHEDLLPYLMRRLLENGANSSFVNMLMDKKTPVQELLKDPIEETRKRGITANPDLPEPHAIYSDRNNSPGYDLGIKVMLHKLKNDITEFKDCFWQALPTYKDGKDASNKENVTEPANNSNAAGYVVKEKVENVGAIVSTASEAFIEWQRVSVEKRAEIIEKFGRKLLENEAEAIALIMREAGRTLPDAISEVREAIDFCNYYAACARKLFGTDMKLEGPTGEYNSLHFAGRGIFVCISPWNFPLAIFTGQVVAALVTGNCVVAKPSEQTPLIAAFAVRLLHECGIPKDVLFLVPGSGRVIGSELTKDERIAGVVFTGSTETARHINRTLAARDSTIAVLIAETGGQNCMIVDSSALLEQVTDDVIASAFGSAGQRCSALRVLYVQEDVADTLIALLAGAMQELKVGNPFLDPSVDVGPVIDKKARDGLVAHIEKMKKSAKLLAAAPLDQETAAQGTYVAPHMFEIKSISELTREVFGPVLHVIRYKAKDLAKVCDEVNSTGYGLTFGLQSRIEDNVDLVKDRIHAGNIYVNRSMIGATVGVQPFGGEGLSGTGPKAGGPHYLLRFVSERTVTVNTAAIGGNIELLFKK